MKPSLLKLEDANTYSIREFNKPATNGKYYFHPQIELVYFEKSDGICIIGDKVKNFKEGDVFLLGPNLPHLFNTDEKYSNSKLQVKIKVLHFIQDFWGAKFLDLPDLRDIKLLLKKADRGILLRGKIKLEIGEIMKKMLRANGSEKLILLLQALNLVSKSKEQKIILPFGFQPLSNIHLEDRINDIYSYTIKNFYKKIHTKEIASVAYLSEHSFCRYFKTKTGKTYTSFLHEIRIKHACKLLTETNLGITQVINECGFENFTNFFRYFKLITGKTPNEYKKLHNETLITEK